MPTNLNVAGAWHTLSQAAVNVGGVWHNANVFVNVQGVWKQVSKRQIALSVNANTMNFNMLAAAGSPTDPVDVTLTIAAGVWLGSTSPGSAALDTGAGWAAGSTIKIINNGTIAGCGGSGGKGGSQSALDGYGGSGGGNALNLQWPVTIDNTNGHIYGGGGGGGGGGVSENMIGYYRWDQYNPKYIRTYTYFSGGGGGGGEGYNGGIGGAAGGSGATVGGAGSTSGPGGGGSGYSAYGGNGGAGGAGGGWGAAGVTGGGGNTGNTGNWSGSAGGAAGKAVSLNGKSCTITAGNNSTQIIGAIA